MCPADAEDLCCVARTAVEKRISSDGKVHIRETFCTSCPYGNIRNSQRQILDFNGIKRSDLLWSVDLKPFNASSPNTDTNLLMN